MFDGCTALEVNTLAPGKEWKIPAASTTATDWGTNMFKGTKGTLQGQPALNTTYYIKSAFPVIDDCITFSSAEAFTLRTYNASKNWDGKLWTSTDKTNWTEWCGWEVCAEKTGATHNLYVRGNANNTKITGCDDYRYRWVLTGSNISCSGDIETLRGATGDEPSPTQMADECYSGMFRDCTTLTVAPALPATTLARECYSYMFYGCTALEVNKAPPGKEWKIPVTGTTATDWGKDMFTGTAGALQGQPALNAMYYIKSAPVIDDCITFSSGDAFTLKTHNLDKGWNGTLWTSTDKINWIVWNGEEVSAEQMGGTGLYNIHVRGDAVNMVITGGHDFRYRWVLTGSNIACTGNIETLRGATGDEPSPSTLADRCYANMFMDCTSLKNAPALPATALAASCYNLMFSGCTALTNAPALPAMTLADYCYNKMFLGCTALTNAPALPAMMLAESCYYSMFRGCTSLTNAPALPATTLANYCYCGMFEGCTALTNAPALCAMTLAESCYDGMFRGCTALTVAPTLPATTLSQNCYAGMFSGCTALEVNRMAPGKEWKISATSTTLTNWGAGMFRNTKGTLQGQPTLNKTYYVMSALQPVVPGDAIEVSSGRSAQDFSDEVNEYKDCYLRWPLDGKTSENYLTCFTAVPNGGKVMFSLNEEGTNQVCEATTSAKTNTLESVLLKKGTLVIDNPLLGFYYSLKQGGDVMVGEQADLNKLAGRDELKFPLTTDRPRYFYKPLITPTPLPKE